MRHFAPGRGFGAVQKSFRSIFLITALAVSSQPAFGATFSTSFGSSPTTINEGDFDFWQFFFLATDTPANSILGGEITFSWGDGRPDSQRSIGQSIGSLSDSVQASRLYTEDGAFTITASGAIDLGVAFEVCPSPFPGPCPLPPSVIIQQVFPGESVEGSLNLLIENIAPKYTGRLTQDDLTVGVNELFELEVPFYDPGRFDPITVSWDLDEDGLYDDLVQTGGGGLVNNVFTSTILTTFDSAGTRALGFRASDDDGGISFGSLNVEVISAVPVPPALVLFGSGLAIIAGLVRARRRGLTADGADQGNR